MDILNIIAAFLLGFVSCLFIFSYSLTTPNLEFPFGSYQESNVSSPENYIVEEDIILKEDMIILKIENISISRYYDSGSMAPVLDHNTNGIRIKPRNENEIGVGDIISFRKGESLIVHRVIEKGEDLYGTYFICKGDNNDFNDGKIRFKEVEYKTIGLLY
jgi:hypothetical protein